MTTPPRRRRDRFRVKDLARIFTEEEQRKEDENARREFREPYTVDPITERTVMTYRWMSLPAPPGKKPNRYQYNPMPLPRQEDPRRPVWEPEEGETLDQLEARLREWWVNRPGPGARTDLHPPTAPADNSPIPVYTASMVAADPTVAAAVQRTRKTAPES